MKQKKGENHTIKGEGINRRMDDGDDGNTISANFENSASIHYLSSI